MFANPRDIDAQQEVLFTPVILNSFEEKLATYQELTIVYLTFSSTKLDNPFGIDTFYSIVYLKYLFTADVRHRCHSGVAGLRIF